MSENVVNLHAIEDEIMGTIEDQDIRFARGKVAAYDEQINTYASQIEELSAKIEEAQQALDKKVLVMQAIEGRREAAIDYLHNLERLDRS